MAGDREGVRKERGGAMEHWSRKRQREGKGWKERLEWGKEERETGRRKEEEKK